MKKIRFSIEKLAVLLSVKIGEEVVVKKVPTLEDLTQEEMNDKNIVKNVYVFTPASCSNGGFTGFDNFLGLTIVKWNNPEEEIELYKNQAFNYDNILLLLRDGQLDSDGLIYGEHLKEFQDENNYLIDGQWSGKVLITDKEWDDLAS